MPSAGPKEQTEQTNSYICGSNITKAYVKMINMAWQFSVVLCFVWTDSN